MKLHNQNLSQKENPLEKVGPFGRWLISTFGLSPVLGSKEQLYSPNLPQIDTGEVGDLKSTLQALNWDIWHLYPNISRFKITLRDFNPLLFCFGMLTRYKPILSYSEGHNQEGLEYILSVQLRLAKLRNSNQIEKYWKLSELIISKSDTYLLCCMHKVDKNLYRKLTVNEMKELIRTINKLRGKFSGTLDCRIKFTRAYIPKGEKFRPLGVPSLAWRIYLNMLLNPLVSFTNRNLKDSQHGFRPKLGTFTAWKSIFKDLLKALFVFDIDLKQCFPSISLPSLEDTLRRIHKLPPQVAKFYVSLNYMIPMLPEVINLDESQMLNLKLRINSYSQSEVNQFFSMWNTLSKEYLSLYKGHRPGVPQFGFLPALAREIAHEVDKLDLTPGSFEQISRSRLLEAYKPDKYSDSDPIMSDEILSTFKASLHHLKVKRTKVASTSLINYMIESVDSIIETPSDQYKNVLLDIKSQKAQSQYANALKQLGSTQKVNPNKAGVHYTPAHTYLADFSVLNTYEASIFVGMAPGSIDMWPSQSHNDLMLADVMTDVPAYSHHLDVLKLIGIAQGANTSPYLSILQIDKMVRDLPSFIKVKIYADDMIFYSNDNKSLYWFTEELPTFLAKYGLLLHPGKSGFVKVGDWLKPLKFLGLTYDGNTDTLTASTRNGSTLVYNKAELLEYEYTRDSSMLWIMSDSLAKQLDKLVASVDKKYELLLSYMGIDLLTSEAISKHFPIKYWQTVYGFNKRLAARFQPRPKGYQFPDHKLSEDHGYWRWLLGKLQVDFAGIVWLWDIYKFLIHFIRLEKHAIISFLVAGLMSFKDKHGLRSWLRANYSKEGVPKLSDPSVVEASLLFTSNPRLYSDFETVQEQNFPIKSVLRNYPVESKYLVWEGYSVGFPEIPAIVPYFTTDFVKYIQTNFPLLEKFYESLTSRSISIFDTDISNILTRIYPLYEYFRTDKTMNPVEYSNGYLKKYRSKFTWQNFINSQLSGMIIARLYCGDYLLDNLVQNFRYEVKEGSLAEFMKQDPFFEDRFAIVRSDLTIFTGTSYSIPYLYDLIEKVGKGPPRKKGSYFADPPLPQEDGQK
jgi:hypothetical protein